LSFAFAGKGLCRFPEADTLTVTSIWSDGADEEKTLVPVFTSSCELERLRGGREMIPKTKIKTIITTNPSNAGHIFIPPDLRRYVDA
jgi:hypothetical protein